MRDIPPQAPLCVLVGVMILALLVAIPIVALRRKPQIAQVPLNPFVANIPESSFGSCYKCRKSWKYVEAHSTSYSETRGMFPLCETCWGKLTPQERLPYYRQLFESWKQWEEQSDEKWTQIEEAVLAGN